MCQIGPATGRNGPGLLLGPRPGGKKIAGCGSRGRKCEPSLSPQARRHQTDLRSGNKYTTFYTVVGVGWVSEAVSTCREWRWPIGVQLLVRIAMRSGGNRGLCISSTGGSET
jgi:hypothetical protein